MNKGRENRKIANEIKKQHFTIGDPVKQLSQETSHQATFGKSGSVSYASASAQQLSHDNKVELRKAHFKFGNDPALYETTQKVFMTNGNGNRSASDLFGLKQAQTER